MWSVVEMSDCLSSVYILSSALLPRECQTSNMVVCAMHGRKLLFTSSRQLSFKSVQAVHCAGHVLLFAQQLCSAMQSCMPSDCCTAGTAARLHALCEGFEQ